MKLPSSEKVYDIPLDIFDESTSNPRTTFTASSLEEMAETIRTAGVVQPVVFRPHPETKGRLQLVAGARRCRASRLAGKSTIPGVIRSLTDEQVLIIQFIENDQRENLAPLSQGRGYAALMKQNPSLYTVEEISARLGKKDGRYVAERLQLLQAIPAVQTLLEEERLPYRHAFELSRLLPEQQEKALYVCFSNYTSAADVLARPNQTVSVSLDALRTWIQIHCHLDLTQAPFPTDQPINGVVACKECPKRTGASGNLFSDLTGEETCRDPECFQKKTKDFVQIQVQQAETSGAQVTRVSTSLRVGAADESSDVLYKGEYRIVDRDSCAFAHIGVPADGSGKQIYICTEETCPVHKGKSKYATAEEKEVKKTKQRDQREEKDFRGKVLEAVRDRVPKGAHKNELLIVAKRMLRLMPHDNRTALFKAFKWLEQKSAGQRGGKHVDYVTLAESRLDKFGSYELLQFLVVASLTPDLIIPDNKPEQTLPSGSELATTARRLGIDLRTLRKAKKARPEKTAKNTAKPTSKPS